MEELLTTEPGPPKGAKPVNGIAKTIAPPAGAKKKEDTVSEPDSNDGSTQAGLDVSQEPGPKGAKPSGRSTESKPGFFNNLKSIWDELVTDFNTTNTQEAPADPLVNAVKRGLNLANQAETISPFNTPTKKDFKDIAKGQAELTTLPSSKEYQKFSSSETFGDALKALKDNPVQIIAELTGESLSSLASYGASRIAAGAGMGAAAGSVVPGIGTAAGAGSGLIVGLADTSLALEYSSKFIEVLKEQGVDVTDEKSLEAAFSNEEIISKARESAYKKSIPIAIFDLISGGIAGKIVKKPASSLLGKVASGAAEFAVQSGLGGGGELAGQIAAGEKIQPGAIVGEMIGELGTTPVEVMANTAGTIKQGLSTPPSPDVVVSEARTSVKSADDTQGAENAAEKIIATTQSPNATEGQQLTTQTDGQERNGQGRQEELLTQETGGWKAGDIIPANYPQPERVIKSVDADLSDTMVKVTFENGTKGAIQKKKPTPVVEEKPAETKQSTPAQAIDKYENDEKFTIDDLVDELESSDDPKIQEAVSKYRADVREGLEVWGGREDSEARETGFVNEVRKITGETPSQTPTGLEKTSGIFYRVDTGMTQSKNATAKDIVDFEADELGNEDVQIGREKAKEMGIDLSQYSHKDIVWVTKSKEAAERYGASEDVQEVPIQSGTVIAEDGDGGYLILKGKPTEKPQSQQPTPDITTVGDNYQKVGNEWQVKQADGTWADIVTDTPNKTPEQQSAELTQIKDLLTQMEASEPQNLKMSPTEKGRIKKLDPQTEHGAARKFFWDGGKVLWSTHDPKSSIPRKGIAEEGGLSERDKTPIENYVDDKKGLSIDQIVESIIDQYTDTEGNKRFTDADAVKTAVIEVLAQSDPKTWYAEQMETEDQEYLLGKPARDEEMSNLSGKIARLETEEQGINETNKQLYENERRVNRGGESQSGGKTNVQVRGEQKEEKGGGEPEVLIQQNGNRDKSQQALKQLKTLNLTHVPGLGMGQNQAKGTYISTEEQNRYETADKKAIPVAVAITNPYVADESYFDIERAAIQKRFGKNAIEDLDPAELDLLSTMMSEYFVKEGYDSIYFPQSETQEGELIVFDRSKVTIMDDARIEYENAVHASTQTTLQLEFVPDAEFLKTDKPIELREKQKKIRKDLARLNQLIKCR